jgi:hypothetical protein
MSKLVLIASVVLVVVAAIGIVIGQKRETNKTDVQLAALVQRLPHPATSTVDFHTLSTLPPPVSRYFRHVLTDGQALISTATLQQSGLLRTSTTTDTWSEFTARHVVVPPVTGFLWNAKVATPLATHVRVVDSYIAGVGGGRVTLFSALTVAAESGEPELNSGALHRYLAEAVWYPTALLPQSGVRWSPVDDRAAIATVTDRGTEVSLVFRFNDIGEVVGIYTPDRFQRFEQEYRQVPWEGHFRDFELRGGMRVPSYGEVGWYENETLEIVWKGNLVNAQYQFTPESGSTR